MREKFMFNKGLKILGIIRTENKIYGENYA